MKLKSVLTASAAAGLAMLLTACSSVGNDGELASSITIHHDSADSPGSGSFSVEMGRLLNDQQTPEETAANMQSAVEQASRSAGQPGW